MKLADIMRQLADRIDQRDAAVSPNTGEPLTPDHDGTFLPPLQAKVELLKKAVGVENKYDEMAAEQGEDDPEASNHKVTPMEPEEADALERMKRAAGVNAVALSELADDEPLES